MPLVTVLTERFRMMNYSQGRHLTCQPDHCRAYNYTERYTAGSGLVYGYPPSGGVLTRSVDALELVHLGLDRFSNARRSWDIFKEDKFCDDLRYIGAEWWPYREACSCPCVDHIDIVAWRVRIETGWPETGGVWVMEYPSRSEKGAKYPRKWQGTS